MICVDTTFLVDLWRSGGDNGRGCVRLLRQHDGETFVVPAHAAGEFLEGGASISPQRFNDSVRFLRMFQIGTVNMETAELYAKAVADLRTRSLLAGLSKPDLWIAAWALEHGCRLVTRNAKHFERVRGLEVVPYDA